MRRRGALLAGFLILLLLPAAFGQDLYWEDPEFLVPQGGRFPQAKAGGGVMATAWQETRSFPDGKIEAYLSIKTTRDGLTWRENRRFAGPYVYYGNETTIFSLAVDQRGGIRFAVLSSENTVDFYVSGDEGMTFSKASTRLSVNTTLAPRLFIKDDGGYLLFVTQERNDILTIFSSVSNDGVTWSNFQALAPEREVTLSFLPSHVSFKGREYVAFQAQRSGEGGGYQLYLKYSDDGGRTWGRLEWLSGFEEIIPGRVTRASLFDNQRPHINAVNGTLAVAWERKFGRDSKQVYYLELTPDGKMKGTPEKVTAGLKTANFPQIIRFQNTTYLLWFDNRKGEDHIILANKQGLLWTEKDLSPLNGGNTFGRPVVNNGSFYVFWENKRGDSSRLVYLKPDTTAQPPDIIPGNFLAGKRSKSSQVRLSWTLPRDSSGIAGFSYVWSRSKEPKVEKRLMVLENVRTAEFTANEDGPWYFHIIAQDYAGNWSQPETIRYFRDTTPPKAVSFVEPEKDESGYLASNTFSLKWNPPDDEDVVGYTYSFDYIGESRDPLEARTVSLAPPPRNFMTADTSVAYRNQDNGLWALNVAAVDEVGNIGPEKALFVHLNKYIPVTYIAFVDAAKDDVGNINLNILGRGFAADGYVSEVFLDQDGKEPYDYVFPLGSGAFTVRSDRNIVGPSIAEIKDGNYRLGVVHPLRGTAFAGNLLRMERSGTIKFGDYSIVYKPTFTLERRAPILFSGNALVVWTSVLLLSFLLFFSITRLGALINESRRLRLEVLALVSGETTPWAKKQEKLSAMKKQGIGLRIKFTLFITVLVITVVLMVSIPLGFYMTRNEERNLAEGLSQRSSVLLESLAAGGRTYLPGGNTLELGVLPSQISAMAEARFATISGRGQADPTNYGYVWASNDPEILKKIGQDVLLPGASKINDDVAEKEKALADDINNQAKTAVSDLAQELDRLAGEAIKLATRTDAESQKRLQDLQNNIRTLDTRVNEKLAAIGAKTGSAPDFSKERLDFGKSTYTFYKPIVYRSRGENVYYRGLVRLGVSTEAIIEQVRASRTNLILITGIVALIALVVGAIGALILASITIIPIKRLVKGVERIRDTEDKSKLKDHVIQVNTRDEIFLLAETVNQMTQSLVKAAAASKDLTVGKEIQKMFIPLEKDNLGKKLTTGKEDSQGAEFFGYYEGAKGVSGDYFDYMKLDADHYAIIKCDVAGKGVPAALIMVEVATIFISYFKDWSPKKVGTDLVTLVYRINTLLEERGFKGRFAAMTVGLFNQKTGVIHLCNAGDTQVQTYDAASRKVVLRTLPTSPAAGVFPSMLVEMKSGFQQIALPLKAGDFVLFYTDGVEEAKRILRDSNYKVRPITEEDLKKGLVPEDLKPGTEDEMMGPERNQEIIGTVMAKKQFTLTKLFNPLGDEELVFDFSTCEASVEHAIMAMVSVEKIFRMYPTPKANADNRIMIDVKVDEFLKKHFRQYSRYFHHPIPNPNPEDYGNYNFYTHMMEDDQYDDLTLIGIRKK